MTEEIVNICFKVGQELIKVKAPIGVSILQLAHDEIEKKFQHHKKEDIGLEGACEGSLACSTCHVILDKDSYDKLPETTEDEEDMLDMAFGLTATSRLGCQIFVTKELEGAVFTIPSKTRNS